jgi:rhodanese-related sulfurtransferase
MTTSADLLTLARQRAQENKLPYAGALTPQEAYALLQENPQVKLVDVRTTAERDWIGRPNIAPEQHVAVQWNLYPGGAPNPDFLPQLADAVGKENILLFLCRGAVRSRHAAKLASENGYANCYDILEGFEGEKDGEGHRKNVNGWCHAGLPWLGA